MGRRILQEDGPFIGPVEASENRYVLGFNVIGVKPAHRHQHHPAIRFYVFDLGPKSICVSHEHYCVAFAAKAILQAAFTESFWFKTNSLDFPCEILFYGVEKT